MAWINARKPSAGHIAWLWVFGVLGSGAYFGTAAAIYVLVGERSIEWAILGWLIGAAAGVACGLATMMWVFPCLLESDLSRSLPFVFWLTLVGSAFAGITGWLALVLVPACNIGACLLAYRRYNLPKWRRHRGLCEVCAYDVRGIRSAVCPECGSEIVDRLAD